MNPPKPTRRPWRSTAARCLALGALAVLPALAQDLSAIKVPPRFTRPAADTDEGGLWGLMDREEMKLKRSPLTIRDKALQAYLHGLVCKLSEGH